MLLKIKKMKYILNFSIFTGIVPTSFLGIIFSNSNNVSIEFSNKTDFFNANILKFGDKYLSLRSNPMNNFVSLTTSQVGSGNIKEQFTYVLCDTATSLDKIKYGKNSGVAKLDYEGNVVALWTLSNTGRGQENEYIYTTNIVFGDTEETVYVLCGISNPAAALNSVYGDAKVPTKINYDENANLQDSNTAYFYRNKLFPYRVFKRDSKSKYKVDITNYSFVNYPKIKIYKLDANDLTQSTKYDFEFPPAEAIRKKGVVANEDEYDKTIIAGFGGGQHLNYWSTNSTWITNYQTKNNQSVSLMNSSFFHYLQFGQTFDYVGNEQFMMIPKYVGIDPNLGGLYSFIDEELTGSVSSLSSYPSLYNVLYNCRGKPSVNADTKTIDFAIPTKPVFSHQYQYLDGLGKKVNVTSDSEYALKESVINLILLSIGYFLPDHEWSKNYNADMTLAAKCPVPSWLLNTYGIICFSPVGEKINGKYKLYVFNIDMSYKGSPHTFLTSQFVIDNVFIAEGADNKKRYRFFLRTAFLSKETSTSYADYYNADGRTSILFGIRAPNGRLSSLGFTWNEFVSAYDTIQNSQFNTIKQNIDLTGVNANSYDWSDRDVNKEYYDNLNSIFTAKNYCRYLVYPLGWYSDKEFLPVNVSVGNVDSNYGFFSNSSGSKYINYGDKILISDPAYMTKLSVVDSMNFANSIRENYKNSFQYSYYDIDSLMLFNRISVLFSFLHGEGFGYLTYKNELKLCLLPVDELQNKNIQLAPENFKSLFLSKKQLSIFQSVVPVGKMLFIRVLNSDGTISNGYFDIKKMAIENSWNNTKFSSYNELIAWIVACAFIALITFIVSTFIIVVLVRKKAKLQIANTKISNKKIDMLSTTVARSFQIFNESANVLSKNNPKVLTSIMLDKSILSPQMMFKLSKQENKSLKEIIPTRLTDFQVKTLKHSWSIPLKSVKDLTDLSKAKK